MITIHRIQRIRKPHPLDTKAHHRDLKAKQAAVHEQMKREQGKQA